MAAPSSPAAPRSPARSPPTCLSPADQPHAPPHPPTPFSSTHYNPCCYRPFKWHFIWNLFMSSPRTRSWLFHNQPPDSAHVIQSLLSAPLLLGYVFGSHNPQQHDFPDIGDLNTVFTTDNHTLLGFHFGFQGIQPVIPMLFQVANDPILADPTVIVRRTAMLRYPAANCFFQIEMNWCKSGVLAVCTNVCPIHPSGSRPDGLTPFFDNAEFRVFKRCSAQRLAATAAIMADYSPSASHAADPHPRYAHFFDPQDDCYALTICEPDDPVYHTHLRPVSIRRKPSHPHTFTIQQHMPPHEQSTCAHPSNSLSALPRHCDQGERASVAEPHTIALWTAFQNVVAQSRRLGIMHSMLEKRVGGRHGRRVQLFGREACYTFLSTSGINVRGRIHRLCAQIGIHYSGPCTDRFLLQLSRAERDAPPPECARARAHGATQHIDLTEPLSECSADGKRRRLRDEREPAQALRHPAPPHGVRDAPASRALAVVRVERAAHGARGAASSCSAAAAAAAAAGGGASAAVHHVADAGGVSHLGPPFDDVRHAPAGHPRPRPASPHGMENESLVTAAERPERCDKSSNFQVAAPPVLNIGPVTLKRRRSCSVARVSEDSSQSSGCEQPFCQSPPYVSKAAASSANSTSGSDLGFALTGANTDESHRGAGAPAPETDVTAGRPATTIWTCEICGVAIRGKKGNLNRHIANKHDNIRAYACQVPSCGKRFQTRLNLVRHEKAVHQGRPYVCHHCPRRFKTDDHLEAHVSSAHEVTSAQLACEVCGGCFGRRSTLNRHLANVHKIHPKTLTSLVSPAEPEAPE